MSELSNTRRSYDLVADQYASEIADELSTKPLDRALLNGFCELVGGSAVLDVGCGPGHVGRYLRERGVQVTGIDLSQAMCTVAAGADSSLPVCVADMAALPIRSGAVAGAVCMYAVIHLDAKHRALAYAELARVLCPGGHALVAFHIRDAENPAGDSRTMTRWWDEDVDLTFRFLDPAAEAKTLADVGFELVARLDRAPHDGHEHASDRSYLLLRRA
ncbi:class I SAM-dependent methyltransferase [Jatrophihabitans sp. DSM 45814]